MKNFLSFLFIFLIINGIQAQKFNNLALTPPMGWNSWNYFQCKGINEKVIKEIADAMVSSGMKDAGYEYIVIDDCWQVARDENGNIVADSVKFPSGIKVLADYIHSKGLKFGIYSDAGTHTCAGRPGSRGYQYQDAKQYAKWGVDYLKYDWCYNEGQKAEAAYKTMRDALYAAGRPIVFSICEWGTNKPWEWAPSIGHLWRTTGDIYHCWDCGSSKTSGGIVKILDLQEGLEKYAGPGHWNDPDMLEVGNGKLTEAENRAHFSLWCMLAAPLMAGNDLRDMDKQTRKILTNKEVIAIDQDEWGIQGKVIKKAGLIHIWEKDLHDGKAVCFFNRADKEQTITIPWKELGIEGNYDIRDLWHHKNSGNTLKGPLAEYTIGPHDVVVLKLKRSM